VHQIRHVGRSRLWRIALTAEGMAIAALGAAYLPPRLTPYGARGDPVVRCKRVKRGTSSGFGASFDRGRPPFTTATLLRGDFGTCGTWSVMLRDYDHPLGIGEIGQEFAPILVDHDNIFDLHTEVESGLEHERLEGEHHASLQWLTDSRP
jgi:hypothetical protein